MKKKIIDILTLCASFLALILGAVGFIRDCHQDEKLNEITYWNNALQNRPLLKVLRPPTIVSYQLDGGKIAKKDLYGINKASKDPIPLNCITTLTFRTVFINAGNSIAKINAITLSDTTSATPIIRDKLLTGGINNWNILKDDSYYPPTEIAVGDSMAFENTVTVQFINKSTFTIHLLILYSNEMDILYDTYYWVRFETGELIIRPEFRIQGKYLQCRFVPVSGNMPDYITFKDCNQSTRVYNRDETDEIFKKWDALDKKSIKDSSVHMP